MRSVFVCISVLILVEIATGDVTTRLKYSATVAELPNTDVLRPDLGDFFLNQQFDARFQFNGNHGAWSWDLDATASILKGELIKSESINRVPEEYQRGSQARFQFDLAKRFHATANDAVIGGIDRAVIQYRQPSWSIRIGRDALTWGSGIVFHPLDLFSPFSPTAVDREFKTAADSVLIEKLFHNGADLQLLRIFRTPFGASSEAGTTALKYRGVTSVFDYEFVAAQHYEEDVLAATLHAPLGGAMLRADVVRSCGRSDCVVSSVINFDYTLALKGAAVYVFLEYFQNGYGVSNLNGGLQNLPEGLLLRQQRGEVFNLMQEYLATGLSVPWHPLWNQTVTLLRNLNDDGMLLHTFVGFDPSDNIRLQFGIQYPFAKLGDEFGGLRLPGGSTTGGGSSVLVNLAYYM